MYKKMVSIIYNDSFKYSHRVLLVSHSQGNLFANRVYDSLFPKEYQNYFANVQVASPANSVHAKMGTYITGWIDPVINPIPGSMPANADLDSPGHSFVSAYLESEDTHKKIVAAIKLQLSNLNNTKSMWDLNTSEIKNITCSEKNIKITAKHFDKNISNIKVFPFKTSNYKIYSVNGKYVAAKCGGKKIEQNWPDKTDNQCYLLYPLEEIIYKYKKQCGFYVSYKDKSAFYNKDTFFTVASNGCSCFPYNEYTFYVKIL